MICVLGDIHFRDDKDYFKRTCEEFLNWYKNWDKNNLNNTLILAGDLVESSLLSGTVADYLERLYEYSQFKDIHICCGNHDKKKYHNEDQLAYEFYKNKPRVHIYEESEIVNIDGLETLMLPYYTGLNKSGKSMTDYYSSLANTLQSHFDLIVGHFCGEDMSYFGSAECVDMSKFNADKIILGHIHTRSVNSNVYIGSVFAGKKSENDYTRSAMIYDGSWYEDKLPLFNEFVQVVYPDNLPKTNAVVPVYTVLNCSSESVARAKYGNIYIKRTTVDDVDIAASKRIDIDRQFSSIKEMNTLDLFNAFVSHQDIPIDPAIVNDCRQLLGLTN